MNLLRAIKLCRELEDQFSKCSPLLHVTLGGGCLFNDDDRKDADIFAYFHTKDEEPLDFNLWYQILEQHLAPLKFDIECGVSASGWAPRNCMHLRRNTETGVDVIDLVFMRRP